MTRTHLTTSLAFLLGCMAAAGTIDRQVAEEMPLLVGPVMSSADEGMENHEYHRYAVLTIDGGQCK